MTGLKALAWIDENGRLWDERLHEATDTPLVSLPAVVEALEEVLAHEADGRPNTGYRLLKTLAAHLRALKESA